MHALPLCIASRRSALAAYLLSPALLALALALDVPIGNCSRSPAIPSITGGPTLSAQAMLFQSMYHQQEDAGAAACPCPFIDDSKRTKSNMQLQYGDADLYEPDVDAQVLCDADPYEPDVDADLRAKERDPWEHPDAQYMSTTQQGRMSPSTRAELEIGRAHV